MKGRTVMTVEQAVSFALAEARIENEPTSQHTYNWHAKRILEHWGASKELAEITRLEVQDWCNGMRSKFKPATIRHKLAFFNRLYRIARDRGEEIPRPSTDLRLPKINNRRNDYADLEKLQAIRPFLKPWRFSICMLAFETGLRRLELYRLEIGDIEIFSEEMDVNGKRTLVEVGLAHVRETKTHQARMVALNVEATAIVKQWIGISTARGQKYLLGPYHGSRLGQADTLSSALRAACRKAGVKFSMHLLRHGFATVATKNGAKSEHVRMQLGHTTLQQTARYQHHDKSCMWPAVFAVSNVNR